MPTKAQKKRKLNKAAYQKRINQDPEPSPPNTPIAKHPRLPGVESLNFSSSDESEDESSSGHSESEDSVEENEEFPVVIDPKSVNEPGLFYYLITTKNTFTSNFICVTKLFDM